MDLCYAITFSIHNMETCKHWKEVFDYVEQQLSHLTQIKVFGYGYQEETNFLI